MTSDDTQTAVLPAPPADYLSTFSTRDLQQMMREARTLPLESLLNRGAVAIDYEHRRIRRDSYWKGSFAKDNLLGWEERILTPIRPGLPPYTGGRFWKRMDEIRDGRALGHVVNYGLRFLPGLPDVRQVAYPDDARRYVKAGDQVLLLTYRNPPYRIVYDLIKIVDADNCIGVMHIGTFPRGWEFATFVMARNNYPFESMAVPDHDAVFDGDRARAPSLAELQGSWTGYLVFLRQPDAALHNQFNPPLLRLDVSAAGTAAVTVGLVTRPKQVRIEADRARLTDTSAFADELRLVDAETLVARRVRQGSNAAVRRYVLKRRVPAAPAAARPA
jgi:hypothetical protein